MSIENLGDIYRNTSNLEKKIKNLEERIKEAYNLSKEREQQNAVNQESSHQDFYEETHRKFQEKTHLLALEAYLEHLKELENLYQELLESKEKELEVAIESKGQFESGDMEFLNMEITSKQKEIQEIKEKRKEVEEEIKETEEKVIALKSKPSQKETTEAIN